jgi:hypothetical protein
VAALDWPWQYQISASQMNQYTAVPMPKLSAAFDLFTVPVSGTGRIAHYAVGRGGRPQSFSSFWDGFTGKDNTGTIMNPVTSWLV